MLDKNLNFDVHISHLKSLLSKHCGILTKLRHSVPKHLTIRYYQSNVKPLINYGILIYGCTSQNKLNAIWRLQKKMLRIVNFLPSHESTFELFHKYRILTVHELFLYELLKFVAKSLNNQHSCTYLNSLFAFCEHTKTTRSKLLKKLKIPRSSNKLQKTSLATRGAKLWNYLIDLNAIPEIIPDYTTQQFKMFLKNVSDCFIAQNTHLLNAICC